MRTLVERLRDHREVLGYDEPLLMEAAAEVERLTAELDVWAVAAGRARAERDEAERTLATLKDELPRLRSKVFRLERDLAEARAKYDELATALWPCRNLLALMNGDGGHRQHGIGIEQAAKEAEAKYTRMLNALAALPTPPKETI